MFDKLIDILKANPRRIVFTEGPDARILEAASRLKKDGFLTPVLVGNVEEVKAAAAKGGFNIEGLEIIDPLTYDKMDEMVDAMVALRKGKMTPEECRELLKKGNYFGTMLVKMGVADSLLGGATYSTADTVRPALQLIKTQSGRASRLLLLHSGTRRRRSCLAMGDCAINISYEDSVDKEGNVTVLRRAEARRGRHRDRPHRQDLRHRPEGRHADLLHQGLRQGRDRRRSAARPPQGRQGNWLPSSHIDGEMQFDAAVSPTVGQLKFPGSKVAGYANTFIFPVHRGRQHRLQDRAASRRLRRLRPDPAGPERPDQRPLPRLQRRRGLQDGHHHRRARLST